MKTDIQEKRIYRYLLGDLPQEEESALEQNFLADGDLFEQVWAAENELIDRYVRGKLIPADKHLFEDHYLASPVHRERLALARNLVRTADSASEKEKSDLGTKPAANWWNSLLAGWNSNQFRWAMAAAVLLLAAGSIWLFAENIRLREQIHLSRDAALEQRLQELEKELSAQREQRDDLAAELDGLREEQSPTVGSQTQTSQVEQRSVVSFLLSPVLMRGGSEPQELKIPKETNAVLLKMNVQATDGRGFQATLSTVEGSRIWSRSAHKSRAQGKNGSTVSISIPANKLPTSDYILTLSAINKANEPEEINRYFFRVIRQ